MRPSQYTDSDCPTCPHRMKAAELPADFKVPRAASVLRHSVTESIRNAILVGRFQPGERLPERELCEMTGVSRSEEHTSELQSLMRISYAVFCLTKKKN